MFFFHHPKPFLQKPVAVMVVASRARALPSVHLLIVEQSAAGRPDAAEDEAPDRRDGFGRHGL